MSIYGITNDFFINHIPEIAFVFVSLIYIFFYKYLFIFSERIFRGLTFSIFENSPTVMQIIGLVDSFIVFIITLIFILPLVKKVLHLYLEPLLNTYYLTYIVAVFFALSYLYYVMIYRKHLTDSSFRQ